MKYIVVEESPNGGDCWTMWEGDSLLEGIKQAREFEYINQRDNLGHEVVLVDKDSYEDGNYNPIDYSEKTIHDIMESYNLSRKELAKKFGINYRTVQKWALPEDREDARQCPDYTLNMMDTILIIEESNK